MQRVDLRNHGRRPDGADGAGGFGCDSRDRRADAKPDADCRERCHGHRHADRGIQVCAEGDGPKRQQLKQPGREDVRGVARWVGDAQHVGHGLHLAPVVKRLARHERLEVEDHRRDKDQQRRKPCRQTCRIAANPAGPFACVPAQRGGGKRQRVVPEHRLAFPRADTRCGAGRS